MKQQIFDKMVEKRKMAPNCSSMLQENNFIFSNDY